MVERKKKWFEESQKILGETMTIDKATKNLFL